MGSKTVAPVAELVDQLDEHVRLHEWVAYQLNAADAERINARPDANHHDEGQECPALVVRTWGPHTVNLTVFPDNAAPLWVTSRLSRDYVNDRDDFAHLDVSHLVRPGTWHRL